MTDMSVALEEYLRDLANKLEDDEMCNGEVWEDLTKKSPYAEDPDPDVTSLMEAIRTVEPYVGHRKSCKYTTSMSTPGGDYCNCGVGDAVEKVDNIVRDVESDLE